ncbi:hypothetical protein GCM10009104_16440 [Marinobacterium maritimum]|uniref:Uncharacterized protein n=1 Tax=Marinobacterium maritimum TaxID=500162 RepID=A0ABN1I5S7_9GAMM
MPIKLFKDFVDGRICFYWSDYDGQQVSPTMATLQEAEDWWKQYLFSQFVGWERRQSILDRRSNHDKRRRVAKWLYPASVAHRGRRVSDQPVRVDQDLAKEKIRLLKRIVTRSFDSSHLHQR